MGIISWIIFGGLAGWIATRLLGKKMNLVLTIIVGIIGTAVGGFLANLVGRTPVFGFTPLSFLVAILGAVVFLAVFSALQRG